MARRSVIARLLTILALAAGCSGRAPDPTSRSDAATIGGKTLGVQVATVRRFADSGPAFSTFLEAERQAELVAEIAGEIREIRVKEGDRVSEGDTLLRIDDRDEQLAFERDRAEYGWARSQYERVMQLDREGHVSAQEVDQARLQMERADAALGLSRVALTRCAVRSPISGLVWMIRVEPLRHVTVGQPLLRVTDPHRMRASVYLPAEFRGSVGVGTRVQLEPARGGATIAAVVSRVDPLTDPASGTFRVVATFRRGRSQPEPGAEVRLVLPASAGNSACLVPLTTLVQSVGDSTWVWRYDAGRVRRCPVLLGPVRSDAIVIDTGLDPGAQVVVGSSQALEDGAAVEVVVAR